MELKSKYIFAFSLFFLVCLNSLLLLYKNALYFSICIYYFGWAQNLIKTMVVFNATEVCPFHRRETKSNYVKASLRKIFKKNIYYTCIVHDWSWVFGFMPNFLISHNFITLKTVSGMISLLKSVSTTRVLTVADFPVRGLSSRLCLPRLNCIIHFFL